MVDFLVLPADFDEIKKNVMKGKLRFLFEGARGQASYNIEEFARILKGVADFARKNDKVREFDVNPLFIYNDGREALAADVKIIL
jgi:succinyl-CoA synthetase beta subunit